MLHLVVSFSLGTVLWCSTQQQLKNDAKCARMKREHSGSLFAMTVNSRLYQHVNNPLVANTSFSASNLVLSVPYLSNYSADLIPFPRLGEVMKPRPSGSGCRIDSSPPGFFTYILTLMLQTSAGDGSGLLNIDGCRTQCCIKYNWS